jgi:hypothetical protein
MLVNYTLLKKRFKASSIDSIRLCLFIMDKQPSHPINRIAVTVLRIIARMLLYEESVACRLVSKSYRCIWEAGYTRQCEQVARVLGECHTYPSNPYQDKYIRFFVAVRDRSRRIWSEIERTGFRSFVVSTFPCAYCTTITQGCDLQLLPFPGGAVKLGAAEWKQVKRKMHNKNSEFVFFLCDHCLMSRFYRKKWTPNVHCSDHVSNKIVTHVPGYVLAAMVMANDDNKHVVKPFSTAKTKVRMHVISFHLLRILAITRGLKLESSLNITFSSRTTHGTFCLLVDNKEMDELHTNLKEGTPSTAAHDKLRRAVTPQPGVSDSIAVTKYLWYLLGCKDEPMTLRRTSEFESWITLTVWKKTHKRTYQMTDDNTLSDTTGAKKR